MYRTAALGMELASGSGDEVLWQPRPAFVRGSLLLTATVLLERVLAAQETAGLVRYWRPGGQTG
ncbi:hypothetical protein [Actinomyces trachealis]|uniref:hypothetical protein n=1 Tax=Actinomyces trachealis TaxID=2763540 RepID=UPI001892A74B|nr:hypothetical protein [Actinomyces trachealis]